MQRTSGWALLFLVASIGCGRSELSLRPSGPTSTADGGVDGGQCRSDLDCDDGLHCNGAEQCLGGGCLAGPTPRCEDGIACTVDRCEEAFDACASAVDDTRCPPGMLCDVGAGGCIRRDCTSDLECTDGVFCNGEEVCSGGVCMRMAPPTCRGGVDPCSDGFCDSVRDECVAIPLDRDGDGQAPIGCGGGDCDDSNPAIRPGVPEICTNIVDDDCDGAADCASPSCAGRPECGCAPRDVCGNGFDDDCDGAADCMDSDCFADPRCGGGCDPLSLGSMVGARVATGSTIGLPNVLTPGCSPGSSASEQPYRWRAPASGTYTFDTFGSSFDTVLYLLDACPGAERACDDDTGGLQSEVTLTLMAGTEIVIVVDGFSSRAGSYVLNIRAGAPMEICDDFADNDGDGAVDCADSDCAGHPRCCTPSPESCTDGADQDCDRLVDCADPDCAASPACCVPRLEDCGNGRDDDCDRRIDCADTGCFTSPLCCMPSPENCTNGVDDDCDLRRDCGDPDCASAPACCVPRLEICTNGVDDDCDTRVDCADPSCATTPACCVPRPEVCNNAVDDDCDRAVDCADSSCTTSPACCVPIPEMCGDGVDQDCDALIDCADPDCRATPACCVPRPEVCDNFGDDDCDRQVDCADSDCTAAPVCCVAVPESCSDGADQDCDALIDCADPDCASAPVCRPCPDTALGSRLGRVASGTTVGGGNDITPTCVSSSAEDLTFSWAAPFAGEFIFDTNGSTYDTVLAVLDSCTGPQRACDDDSGPGNTSQIRMVLRAGQSILIAVDGWSTRAGNYVLNISAIIGGETNCMDGIDNDFDGATDCLDPDCAATCP